LEYKKKYISWLEDNYFDAETIRELKNIFDDEQEIKERFSFDLEFGTGGLRGIIGAGTNRMNKYTVRKTTQGIADYINKNIIHEKSVVIAYDSRLFSREFAHEAALVLSANKIKVFLFGDITPTPVLSFAVRYLKLTAGIVITASHNPKEYNGYKVYWQDGAQVVSPVDYGMINCVEQISSYRDIKILEEQEAREKKLFFITPPEVNQEYIKAVSMQRINKINQSDLKIVYTPLNGAGNKFVRKILSDSGFKNIFVVKEQELPDPEFKTVGVPNPELASAFNLALKLAQEKNADIIIATDPDSDRIGVIAKDKNNYRHLSGNETGILLCEYILAQKKNNGKLKNNELIISTIVSTKTTKLIAESYGVKYREVLTGFKHICREIKNLSDYNFLFGFEESYGYLIGDHARDKDAIVSAMLICEMADYYKKNNLSLLDALEIIYKKYGYQKEIAESLELKGLDGKDKIKKIMSYLRDENLKEINGLKIKIMKDYKFSIKKNLESMQEEKLDLPESDVIIFELEDNSWLCTRPSGTEPKLKIYLGATGESSHDANLKLKNILESYLCKIKNIIK